MNCSLPKESRVVLRDGRIVTLRPANPDDAQAALDYFIPFFNEAENWMLTAAGEFVMDEAGMRNRFEQQRWGLGDQCWLAWANGQVIASLSASVGRRAKISHRVHVGMDVHSGFRGLGLGRAMLSKCIEEAKLLPAIAKLSLTVFADNNHAISLYRALGFLEEGRRIRDIRRRDGSYVDEVIMGLWLGDGEP